MTKRPLRLAGAAAAFAAFAAPALADEGMWTFDNFPSAAVKAKYGVTIDKAWLDHVQHAAVRLSTGCSASVVSPEGLVLTNHHCVSDCAQDLSTPTQDYIKSGFMAATRREERLCPGMQAEILMTISDVTDRVNAALSGKTGSAFIKARDAVIAGIELKAARVRPRSCAARWSPSIRAASTSSTPTASIRTCGWCSRRSSPPPSSAGTRTTSTSRATTSTAPSCACTRTASRPSCRIICTGTPRRRRRASRCSWPATPARPSGSTPPISSPSCATTPCRRRCCAIRSCAAG